MLTAVKTFGSLVKFSHTIFALPFAFMSVVFASYEVPFSTILEEKIIWIVLAMVGARTAAMGFNRLVDASIDAKNPRTKNREIPTGIIAPHVVLIFVLLSSALLIFSAYQLNDLCFYLSPVALFVIFFYSYTKRFTWLAHIVLGVGIGLAPVGAWIAVTGHFDLLPILLGLAVLCWIAGFDIIYACQDYEFDRNARLKSIPVRFGLEQSLLISRLLHVGMVFSLFLILFLHPVGIFYFAGLLCLIGLLIYEHRLVNPNDFSKLNIAFFNMNGIISVTLFMFILLDRLLGF